METKHKARVSIFAGMKVYSEIRAPSRPEHSQEIVSYRLDFSFILTTSRWLLILGKSNCCARDGPLWFKVEQSKEIKICSEGLVYDMRMTDFLSLVNCLVDGRTRIV